MGSSLPRYVPYPPCDGWARRGEGRGTLRSPCVRMLVWFLLCDAHLLIVAVENDVCWHVPRLVRHPPRLPSSTPRRIPVTPKATRLL